MIEVEDYISKLKAKLDRYEKALHDISNCGAQANPVHLRTLAQTVLDGEPTTADDVNDVFGGTVLDRNYKQEEE